MAASAYFGTARQVAYRIAAAAVEDELRRMTNNPTGWVALDRARAEVVMNELERIRTALRSAGEFNLTREPHGPGCLCPDCREARSAP